MLHSSILWFLHYRFTIMRIMMNHNRLSNRAILSLGGKDRHHFLQGLITGDVNNLPASQVLWAGWLTPQGRLQSTFFLFQTEDMLLLDCPADRATTLQTQINRFRLRADVQIASITCDVLAGAPQEPQPANALICAPDPRHPSMGWRALCPAQQYDAAPAGDHDYLQRRLVHGITDDTDIVPGKTLVLEANMDRLNGVSWDKGCYMGQEVTARTHYRGLIKRRLMPLQSKKGIFPSEGGILYHNKHPVGELRSRTANHALAMIHRDAWNADYLHLNEQIVQLLKPDWFPSIPAPAQTITAETEL